MPKQYKNQTTLEKLKSLVDAHKGEMVPPAPAYNIEFQLKRPLIARTKDDPWVLFSDWGGYGTMHAVVREFIELRSMARYRGSAMRITRIQPYEVLVTVRSLKK